MTDEGRPTTRPATEDVVEQVAEDIYKVTVPVPFRALRAVNCYLLRSPDGWDLVDTGLKTPAALAAWEAAWHHLGITPGALRQIILTHHHPDHMGLAGWFQQAAREVGGRAVPVRTSAREIEVIDIIWQNRRERDEVMQDYFARCGLPDPVGANFSARELDGMRRIMEPFPDSYDVLEGGATLEIGARTFEVIRTPGHSDGHLVFFDPVDQLLLVGDHVLPHITPNISLWPGVEPDPLGRYLDSLRRLASLSVRRALPGHGDVIEQWAARLAGLDTHHAERLDVMARATGTGATVFDVAGEAFSYRTLDRHQARMAVSETLAHLEHLVARGDLMRRDEGAWRYRRV